MDKKDIDKEIDKAVQMIKYLEICRTHGMFDKERNPIVEKLAILAHTMVMMIEREEAIDNTVEDSNKKSEMKFDIAYDQMKVLANAAMFEDAVWPIIEKYNPFNETKQLFVDYVKKMEDKDNE